MKWISFFLLPALFSWNAYAQNLQVGQDAPDFSLLNQDGKTLTLSNLKGQWVVLYFYPKNDTPGCTTEACSFRDNINRLIKQQATIIGISLDSVESHQAFRQKHTLPFDLLSDPDGKVSAQYDSLRDLLVFKMAKRHSFIINPEGKLVKIYQDVDPQTHVHEVLKDLKQLQTANQVSILSSYPNGKRSAS